MKTNVKGSLSSMKYHIYKLILMEKRIQKAKADFDDYYDRITRLCQYEK